MTPPFYYPFLQTLFQNHFGEPFVSANPMAAHGSDRQYVRLQGQRSSCLGAYNPHKKENQAFIAFSRHFLSKGISVPEIYAADEEHDVYLLEDLGDTTLFQHLETLRTNGQLTDEMLRQLYKPVICALIQLQINGGMDLDYTYCYPVSDFDQSAMLWDLNYFKYCFLKPADISFDEYLLEKDFQNLCQFLLQGKINGFLYRDFQSRNIMIRDSEFYFIDYQGGRRGALQYDIASLLFEPKAQLPFTLREELLEFYIQELSKHMPVDRQNFVSLYYGYVYLRAMQALGAYGWRGLYQNKPLFIQSIPLAQRNLAWLQTQVQLPIQLPELHRIFHSIVHLETFRRNDKPSTDKLTVSIRSFSYKKSLPRDLSGNGGGFMFDCRALPNPGRYERYGCFTGKDQEVVDFLEKEPAVTAFLLQATTMVAQSVKTYQQRGFKHLLVAFGCTGGQHRSVYCAEMLSKWLLQNTDVEIDLLHQEQHKG